MGTAKQWTAAVLLPLLAALFAIPAAGAEFELTPADAARVAAREIVIRATLDQSQRRGTVRAAVQIDAPPATVFRLMSRCSDAVQYVPHLVLCRVRDRAPDDSWQLVEHGVDFGWYTPRLKWVFRADFQPERRIDFRQVSGDFKANEGAWELEPIKDGAGTLLRYRSYIDPPGYVPNWLARSTFKRELPKMLEDLRLLCEADARRHPGVHATPSASPN